MLTIHLLVNGLVTGCALGMVAISFSLVYSTTRIFHVAHAGIYTLARLPGMVRRLARHGLPDWAGAAVACRWSPARFWVLAMQRWLPMTNRWSGAMPRTWWC